MTAINTSHTKQASPDLNILYEKKRRNSFQKPHPQGLISYLRVGQHLIALASLNLACSYPALMYLIVYHGVFSLFRQAYISAELQVWVDLKSVSPTERLAEIASHWCRAPVHLIKVASVLSSVLVHSAWNPLQEFQFCWAIFVFFGLLILTWRSSKACFWPGTHTG